VTRWGRAIHVLEVTAILGVLPTLPGCTPATFVWEEPFSGRILAALPREPREYFRGTGDVEVCVDGECHGGRIAVVGEKDQSFMCEVYTPFGTTVVSITADSGDASIIYGEREYSLERSDSLSGILPLSEYPFTFNDLTRILRGVLYTHPDISAPPDTSFGFGRGREKLIWDRQPLKMAAVVNRRSRAVETILITFPSGATATFDEIRDRVSYVVGLNSGVGNYLKVRYRRVQTGYSSTLAGGG
jgi:hypothetical protein